MFCSYSTWHCTCSLATGTLFLSLSKAFLPCLCGPDLVEDSEVLQKHWSWNQAAILHGVIYQLTCCSLLVIFRCWAHAVQGRSQDWPKGGGGGAHLRCDFLSISRGPPPKPRGKNLEFGHFTGWSPPLPAPPLPYIKHLAVLYGECGDVLAVWVGCHLVELPSEVQFRKLACHLLWPPTVGIMWRKWPAPQSLWSQLAKWFSIWEMRA